MYKYLHTVETMSRINPQLLENLSIEVVMYDENEGQIPYVHVYHDKTKNKKNRSVVRLDRAEYSSHHGYPVKLNKQQKRQFVQVMSTVWPKHFVETNTGVRPATGYEYCVVTRANAFEDGSYDKFTLDDNGVPIMPDYDTLG